MRKNGAVDFVDRALTMGGSAARGDIRCSSFRVSQTTCAVALIFFPSRFPPSPSGLVEVSTRSLAKELERRVIDGNVVAPGATATDVGAGTVRDKSGRQRAQTIVLCRLRSVLELGRPRKTMACPTGKLACRQILQKDAARLLEFIRQ